jgi:integrase
VLSKLFKWLVDNKKLKDNPAKLMIKAKPPAQRKRVVGDKRVDPNLSHDEIRCYWKAASEMGVHGLCLKILLLLGLRSDEASEMQRDEIKVITTEKGNRLGVLELVEDRTKNKRKLVLPLPPLAKRLIAQAWRMSGRGKFIFSKNGRVPIHLAGSFKARLDKRMPRDMPHWRIHDIRHTAAVGLQQSGSPLHITMKIMNHSAGGELSAVAAIYQTYAYPEEQLAALVAWEDYLLRRILRVRTGDVVPLKATRQTT